MHSEDPGDKDGQSTSPPPAPSPAAAGGKLPIGFRLLTKEERQAISSKGGKAAHAKGTPYKFTSETAREAGRKGGLAAAARRKAEGSEKP